MYTHVWNCDTKGRWIIFSRVFILLGTGYNPKNLFYNMELMQKNVANVQPSADDN